MILTTDVAYGDGVAAAAGLLHRDWDSEAPDRVIAVRIDEVAPYEPGAFYKRELPCLLRLVQEVGSRLDCVLIDGYVVLGSQEKPGLGWHLYESLGRKTPVVGIAKSAFADTPAACRLLRGSSKTPLFVTAIGMPLDRAKQRVSDMHGHSRIPTLLRMADRACRDHLSEFMAGSG